MKLACVHCQKPLSDNATFCAACGRPTDADGNGVPDALDQLIETKAKGILAAERKAEADVVEQKARVEEIAMLERSTASLAKQIEHNGRVSRSAPAVFLSILKSALVVFTLGWVIFGFPIHLIVFGLATYSPAGPVLCPLQCPTCEGPGRTFFWNSKGWDDNKGKSGWALLCHNPTYDADKVRWTEIRGDLNKPIQPYLVHGVLAFIVEGVLVTAIGSAVYALRRTGKQRRRLDEDYADFERRHAGDLARLALLRGDAPRASPTAPFR